MDAKPFPKSEQLARGRKRYRRVVASPKQWEVLWEAKGGLCRVCRDHAALIELHHLVWREDFGGDVVDNLVPLCRDCHRDVHRREQTICRALLSLLSDEEYAHMVVQGGEDYAERVYGIEYQR